MAEGAGARHDAAPLQRHSLLTIEPRAWPAVIAGHEHALMPLLAAWAANGWPVISRRPAAGDAPGDLPVGVPLPPAAGKLRIALSVPAAAVMAQERLPTLRAAASVAPPSWRRSIDALLAAGERFAMAPSCFGSLCWQFRTGLSYITATSDLDVIWPAGAAAEIPALLDVIAKTEQDCRPRLDGEIIFAGGLAVNWRELHNALRAGGEEQVLVKSAAGAWLAPAGTVLGRERAL